MSSFGLLSLLFAKPLPQLSADICHNKKWNLQLPFTSIGNVRNNMFWNTAAENYFVVITLHEKKTESTGEQSVSFYHHLQEAQQQPEGQGDRAGALSEGHQFCCHSVRSSSARCIASKLIHGLLQWGVVMIWWLIHTCIQWDQTHWHFSSNPANFWSKLIWYRIERAERQRLQCTINGLVSCLSYFYIANNCNYPK